MDESSGPLPLQLPNHERYTRSRTIRCRLTDASKELTDIYGEHAHNPQSLQIFLPFQSWERARRNPKAFTGRTKPPCIIIFLHRNSEKELGPTFRPRRSPLPIAPGRIRTQQTRANRTLFSAINFKWRLVRMKNL